MIVLFTDFGLHGPYTGHMKAVLHQMAPGVPVVDLFADAPVGNPKPSAYLLAAYAVWFAAGTGVPGMHRTFILPREWLEASERSPRVYMPEGT